MLAYENSSSFVVYAIRMRSSCVGGVKSGNYVGLGMTWGSTLSIRGLRPMSCSAKPAKIKPLVDTVGREKRFLLPSVQPMFDIELKSLLRTRLARSIHSRHIE
jgi:hypothetical protein